MNDKKDHQKRTFNELLRLAFLNISVPPADNSKWEEFPYNLYGEDGKTEISQYKSKIWKNLFNFVVYFF